MNSKIKVGDTVFVSRDQKKFVKGTVLHAGYNPQKMVSGYDIRLDEECPEWEEQGRVGYIQTVAFAVEDAFIKQV